MVGEESCSSSCEPRPAILQPIRIPARRKRPDDCAGRTRDIFSNGVWRQNTSWSRFWPCPLLAVTTNFVNGAMLSWPPFWCRWPVSLVMALRNLIPYEIRIPVFILIAAALVTVVDLSINAYLCTRCINILGIFIPLIITNCIVPRPHRSLRRQERAAPVAGRRRLRGLGHAVDPRCSARFGSSSDRELLFSGIDAVIPGLHGLQVLRTIRGFLVAILPRAPSSSGLPGRRQELDDARAASARPTFRRKRHRCGSLRIGRDALAGLVRAWRLATILPDGRNRTCRPAEGSGVALQLRRSGTRRLEGAMVTTQFLPRRLA